MKIAEALIKRATLKSDTDALKERMKKNVKIQEGDTAQENDIELLETYKQKCDDLYELTTGINKTNQLTKNADGESLAELIARRDKYKEIVKTYKTLYDESVIEKMNRFTRNEIKFVCTVSAEKIQNAIQNYSAKYREIDTEIQRLNWLNDLM